MSILLLTLLAASAMVYMPAQVAGSTVSPCTAARAMVDARRISSAVRLFDAAREDGLPCGSGRDARSARATLTNSAAIYLSAKAAETRGRDTVALRRYLRASRLNADNVDAGAAASRLAGLDPLTPSPSPSTSPTPSPFAPAEKLDELGQRAEAEKQALEAVKKGATPSPESVAEDLVQLPIWERRWNAAVDWASTWWIVIGTFLLVGALVLALAAKTRTFRRLTDRRPLTRIPPRLRLKIEAVQASGTDPDLSAGFGVRVQSQVADLTARLQHDPRIVYGADTALAVPMDAAPSQAKYLVALWEWFFQSNTVTAKATLLPPSQRGLGCHVALVERNGAVTRGADPSQQLLMFRPSQWNFDTKETMSTLAWMPLANITTAWTLFAFRSLRARSTRLADEFGTPSSSAYGEMLSGLEFIAGDPQEAATRFRTALEIDEEFLEAALNLASVLANGSEENLAESETILKQVIQRLETPPPLSELSREDTRQVRERALWYRAMYVLAVVKINLLTTGLEVPPPSPEQSTAFDELAQAIDLLLSRIELIMATVVPQNSNDPHGPDWIKGRIEKVGPIRANLEKRRSSKLRAAAGDEALTTLRIQIAPHVRVLQLAIRDLQEKFEAVRDTDHPGTALGYPGLPVNEEQRSRATREHRRVVEEIDKIPLTGSTARVQYSLACLWARDFRMRSDNNREALNRCAERLKRAVRHHEYLNRWRQDPDLEPIVTQLENLRVPKPDPPPPPNEE